MNLMPTLTPATWPWLLQHELRLAWRNMGIKRLWVILIGGGFIWVCMHLAAWGLMKGFHVAAENGVQFPPIAILFFGGATWLAMTMMLSQAIMLSVTALFDRGDFDLLLSSPISARTVFIVRGLGIAINSVLLYVLLFTPFAHVGLFMGHANLLAIYPALIAIGFTVASLGMLLTLTLVRMLGARRARVVAQLVGALVGAALFLLSQTQNLLGRESRQIIADHFKHWIDVGGPLAPDSAVWFPFRALLGEWLPLMMVLLVGFGGFWLVVNLTYRRFLAGTQESVATKAKKKPLAAGSAANAGDIVSGTVKFRAGLLANVLVKEWRLIIRDPNLIAQTFLQMLYLLPLIFLIFRRGEMVMLVVPSAVMLSTTLAGSLAWLTIAAEDAPELVGLAPVPMSRIRWYKALAAVIPVWLIVSPILFYLLLTHPIYGLVFAVCVAGGTLSAGLTNVLCPRKGDRKNMKKRGQGNFLINISEVITAFGWAGMAYALLAAPWFALLALVFMPVGPITAFFLGKSSRAQGVLA